MKEDIINITFKYGEESFEEIVKKIAIQKISIFLNSNEMKIIGLNSHCKEDKSDSNHVDSSFKDVDE